MDYNKMSALFTKTWKVVEMKSVETVFFIIFPNFLNKGGGRSVYT